MWGRQPPPGRRSGRPVRLSASQRLAICGRCPYLARDRRCVSCGCFVRVKTKVPTEKCPHGKW